MKTQTYDDSALTQPCDLNAIHWDCIKAESQSPAASYGEVSESDTGFPDTVPLDEFADTTPGWQQS